MAEDGTVFAFGANFSGQLGLGTYSGSALVATPINTSNLGGRTITQVAAGSFHSLLLADDGSVFSMGDDTLLGLGTAIGQTLVATPIDASNLGGRAIKQVAAGNIHSLLLAEDDTVFSFGSNFVGATGLGTASGVTLVATLIDTSNLGGRPIAYVAVGEIHSLLITVPEPSSAVLMLMVAGFVWKRSTRECLS